jgi:uncharacterized membrane protein
MKSSRLVIILLVFVFCLAIPLPAVAGGSPAAVSVAGSSDAPAVSGTGDGSSVNYTRLEIMPSYLNFVVEPGGSKDLTVTVRNRESRAALVRPVVRVQPYGGPYVAETSWTKVSPASAEIPAGESVKFTVTVAVPDGTLRGSYSSLVTFTDEAYPTPYPQPVPNYIHTLGLSINVASSPVVQIGTPSISDQVEAGNEYLYTIDVRNRGSVPLGLNARLGDEGYPVYGPYGPQEPPLSAGDFSITAPSIIQPGRNGTVTLKVNVPQNASGYFNGNLDLGIDDPSIRLEENRVQLYFLIWKQPEGGFAKTFTIARHEPVTVELTSAYPMMNPVSADGAARQAPRR